APYGADIETLAGYGPQIEALADVAEELQDVIDNMAAIEAAPGAASAAAISANNAALSASQSAASAAAAAQIVDIDSVAVFTNPKAFSQAIHLTPAASGSRGIMVADNPQVNFGTGDFTLYWLGSLPDWTEAGPKHLITKRQTSSAGFQF